MPDNKKSNAQVSLRWLVAGAITGLLAVAVGLLRQSDRDSELPENIVARVNGEMIFRDVYQRALQRLDADSANALDQDDEAWVLQRLIEEELLVQRGLSLGMARSESNVRAAIVQSLIASVTAEADAESPDDATLRKHLNEYPERFSISAALSVDVWTTSEESSATEFLRQLRTGNTNSETAQRLPNVPSGPLPISKLRDYLGPGITAAAANMPIGGSAVFARQGRWLVVQVVDKEDATLAPFDAIKSRILVDYRRSLADSLLRKYLVNLMQQADVVIAQP